MRLCGVVFRRGSAVFSAQKSVPTGESERFCFCGIRGFLRAELLFFGFIECVGKWRGGFRFICEWRGGIIADGFVAVGIAG